MKKQYSLLHLSLIPALLLVFCLFSAGLPDETSAKKERVRMKMYYFKNSLRRSENRHCADRR
jgi:hypothetical protein